MTYNCGVWECPVYLLSALCPKSGFMATNLSPVNRFEHCAGYG